MAEKVVAHALFDYVDPDGVRRVALRGQTIEVDGDSLARGEEHGAFEVPGPTEEPAAPAEATGPETSPPGAVPPAPVPPAEVGERPPLTANKGIWLGFRGLDDLTEEQASAVTLKQLQDDAFMASYQRPTA
jgi:hypothetical protein